MEVYKERSSAQPEHDCCISAASQPGETMTKCPHCGMPMLYELEEEDWVCHHCGYIGTLPEDPMSYIIPSDRTRCRPLS